MNTTAHAVRIVVATTAISTGFPGDCAEIVLMASEEGRTAALDAIAAARAAGVVNRTALAAIARKACAAAVDAAICLLVEEIPEHVCMLDMIDAAYARAARLNLATRLALSVN